MRNLELIYAHLASVQLLRALPTRGDNCEVEQFVKDWVETPVGSESTSKQSRGPELRLCFVS